MALESVEILIVGGGVAGLATARSLVARGAKGVVLLDREEFPGFYASGHNAGIARQLTGLAAHTALTVEGRERMAAAGLLDSRGGFLLGADPGGTAPFFQEASAFGLRVEAGKGCPLPGFWAAEHLHIPSDGLIDVDRMLAFCAAEARGGGARLVFGCGVGRIEPRGEGFDVETDQGLVHARILVNAAGAWAQEIGRSAGGLDIALRPLRRHLVWSGSPWPQEGPWAWWVDRPLYVRPESGGLLLCAVEEEEVPLPVRGQQPVSTETILERLHGSLLELAPACAERPVTRLWCGLRTFAPDRRFLIGRDPVQPRLIWVAGLGGHGMTGGLAIGDLAARVVLEGAESGALEPERFGTERPDPEAGASGRF